eukprot:5582890-Pyramimonas_sp.AAC.1
MSCEPPAARAARDDAVARNVASAQTEKKAQWQASAVDGSTAPASVRAARARHLHCARGRRAPPPLGGALHRRSAGARRPHRQPRNVATANCHCVGGGLCLDL